MPNAVDEPEWYQGQSRGPGDPQLEVVDYRRQAAEFSSSGVVLEDMGVHFRPAGFLSTSSRGSRARASRSFFSSAKGIEVDQSGQAEWAYTFPMGVYFRPAFILALPRQADTCLPGIFSACA